MRFLCMLVCAGFAFFSFQPTQAKIIHVPDDSSSIQGGINGAVNGDTVLVEPERYVENINFFGKAILVASRFILDSLETTIDSTIIDGNQTGSVVTFDSGEDSNSIIEGFTITGGEAEYGGGIYCRGSSPTITRNFIRRNACWYGKGGPGIYLDSASNAKIYGNLISECSGPAAIGIHVDCNAEVINNTVCNNTWGGISIQHQSYARVKNNIFYNNVNYGIHVSQSSWDILYNDIYGSDQNYVGIPDQTGINGNISADPLFCDPEHDNYHLHTASPCYGAGQGGADMGAFGMGCGGVFVTAGNDVAGPPDSEVTVVFYLQNTGPESDTFDLNVSDSLGWEILPAHEEMLLEPGQEDSTFIAVTIPNVDVGTIDLITLMATSRTDSLAWHKASLRVLVSGKIIRVPSEFPTIQEAIDAAGIGDTVLVAEGHYYERVSFLGKAITVASDFIFDNETTTIESTIIDADTSVFGKSDTGSVVVFVSGEESTSVIKGFTIQNGIGTVGPLDNRSGGGIYCFNSSPTISHNIIWNNFANQGGGICCDSSGSIIENNVITDDSAYLGGGIRCWYSSPLIIGNTIRRNSAFDGGAISCDQFSSPAVTNNVIIGNFADYGGGIVCGRDCAPAISRNTITGNSASLVGGGIFLDYNSFPTIANNIISNTLDGEGIHCGDESWPSISYNDTWDNVDGNFSGCPGVGDTAWGTNFNGTPCDSFYNIIRDPLFADTVNFRLFCYSPCIDAGDSSTYVPPESGGCRIDMGAQEYTYMLGDPNRDSSIDMADIIFLIGYSFLGTSGPCPFHTGNVNRDEIIDVADIVYLINHLFLGGPPPRC
jgi:parallel beta-helix repeat protein